MNLLLRLNLLATMPTPVADDNYNSPGTIGFIITFAVAVGAVFLFFDMNRRIRKTKYRSEIREKLAEEDIASFSSEKPQRPEPPTKPQR
ncbi:MAG: hypothetical protein F2536_02075 [Actinobacteria bacterium]|uniref:Unannotated protein n=1 Tax=freshwater metagenome TaxID=449393 RepID=A0A6J6DGA4_9ZZZZ|nr:hypothetical protein [Actinomycetota bacterium]MTA89698.1 hypothetical protein [Actinomycetota bacterium]